MSRGDGWADTLAWDAHTVHGMAEAVRGEGLGPRSDGERHWAIVRLNQMAAAAERQGVNAGELRTLAAHLKYREVL